MFKNISVVSVSLCVATLICSANGESDKDENSMGMYRNAIISYKNFLSSRKFIGIPVLVIRMIPRLIETSRKMVITLLRLTMRSTLTYLSNFLGFLASSDNTNIIYTASYKNFKGNSQRNGGGIALMLSRAFMMPFKFIFGSVRFLPIGSMYTYLISMIPFIDVISENLMVQSVSNTTVTATKMFLGNTWNFIKTSVLPWIDKIITNLHKSNTLPNSLMRYLDELQSLYHMCHYMGIL